MSSLRLGRPCLHLVSHIIGRKLHQQECVGRWTLSVAFEELNLHASECMSNVSLLPRFNGGQHFARAAVLVTDMATAIATQAASNTLQAQTSNPRPMEPLAFSLLGLNGTWSA